jgi:hypothetical protein
MKVFLPIVVGGTSSDAAAAGLSSPTFLEPVATDLEGLSTTLKTAVGELEIALEVGILWEYGE